MFIPHARLQSQIAFRLLLGQGGSKSAFLKSETGSGKTLAYLLPIVQALVERGAQVSKPGKDGVTALHSACGFGKLDVAKYLLARGAKADKHDDDGATPDDCT